MPSSHRILVVDDNAVTRYSVRRVLEHHQFVVEEAGTGGEGLVRLAAEAFAAVVLDVNLPDMSGIDILAKIKANEHTRRSPVVVLTTTDDSREIQRCYDLGANVYITKPVNYEGFANAIRQLGLFFTVMQVPENG